MTSSIEALSTQVIDLQSRLAFQEDALQTLSGQMAQQSQDLRLARQHIQLLNQKLNDLLRQPDPSAMDSLQERPPHY
jgi:SlyX protein